MTQHTGRLPNSTSAATFQPTACFSVVANSDPSALPRVLEVFTKLGEVPSQCHATRVGPGGQELHIDLQFDDMDQATSAHLARTLGGIHLVSLVLTSEKRQQLSA